MSTEVGHPAKEEIKEASNISSFVDSLSALVERDSDQPLVSDSEKLTRYAKDIADEYLSILLEKNNQDFEKVLETLRDTERGVRVNTDVPGNYEILQMVRCMRGKLVYNAHLTYAFEHYAGEFPERANVYTFLKEKGHPQKRHFSQSVYRAATAISRDNADKVDVYGVSAADELALETSAARRVAELAEQNQQIVEEDGGIFGWEGLKDKVHGFGSWLVKNRREIACAGAVAATVIAVSAFGGRVKGQLDGALDRLQKVTQVAVPDKEQENLNTSKLPSVQIWEQDFNTEGEKIKPPAADEATRLVIPQEPVPYTSKPPDIRLWEHGFDTEAKKIKPPVVDEATGLVIPQEAPSDEVQRRYQEPIPSTPASLGGVLGKYIAKSEAEAIKLAQELNFIGSESPYEHPSNMCGPLAASVLKDLGILPAGFEVNPSKFWLANPDRLDRLLPQPMFQKTVMNESVDHVEFDWRIGDFIYLTGGDFDHMLTISKVDAAGKVYGISNYKNAEGKFVVDEFLLLDSTDPSVGLFKEWPKPEHSGTTGQSGVFVWRYTAQNIAGTNNSFSG